MNIKNPTPQIINLKQRAWQFIALGAVSLIMLLGLQVALATPVSATEHETPATTTTTTDIENSLCSGAQLTVQEQTNCDDKAQEAATRIDETIARVLNIFSVVAGAAAVFMLIYAGIRYIVSGGNDGGIKSAKSTMIYAIVGMILVALSQTIVHFVLGNLASGS